MSILWRNMSQWDSSTSNSEDNNPHNLTFEGSMLHQKLLQVEWCGWRRAACFSRKVLHVSHVLMWSCGVGVQLSSLKVMHGNLLFQDSQKTFLNFFGIGRPTDRPVISATSDPKDHRVFVFPFFLLLSSIFPSSLTCFLFSGIFTRSLPLGKRRRALRTFHGCVRVACNTI